MLCQVVTLNKRRAANTASNEGSQDSTPNTANEFLILIFAFLIIYNHYRLIKNHTNHSFFFLTRGNDVLLPKIELE